MYSPTYITPNTTRSKQPTPWARRVSSMHCSPPQQLAPLPYLFTKSFTFIYPLFYPVTTSFALASRNEVQTAMGHGRGLSLYYYPPTHSTGNVFHSFYPAPLGASNYFSLEPDFVDAACVVKSKRSPSAREGCVHVFL